MNKTRGNAGETLVEVMASMVIFLLLAGVLHGAVLYCHAAMEKSRQLRQRNEQVSEAFRAEPDTEITAEKILQFQQTDQDGNRKGSMVFQVPVALGRKQVSYQESDGREKLITFYLYASVRMEEEKDALGGDGK